MKVKNHANKPQLPKRYFTAKEVAGEIKKSETSVKRYADYLGIPMRNGRRLFTVQDIANIRNVSINKHDLSKKGLFLVRQVVEQTKINTKMVDWYGHKLNVLRINNRYYFSEENIATMLSLHKTGSDLSAKGLFTTRQVAEQIGQATSSVIAYGSLMKIPIINRRYYFTKKDIDKIVEQMRKKKDKTGKKSGFLTAIRDTGKKKLMKSGWYSAVWEWQCRCGNKVERALMEVRDKQFGSCGCRTIEAGKRNIQLAIQKQKIFDGVNISTLATKKLRSNNTSGVRGVSFIKRYQKYEAYIKIKGEAHYLGRYKTLEEAKEVRQKAERKYFGPYINGYKEQQKKEKKSKRK